MKKNSEEFLENQNGKNRDNTQGQSQGHTNQDRVFSEDFYQETESYSLQKTEKCSKIDSRRDESNKDMIKDSNSMQNNNEESSKINSDSNTRSPKKLDKKNF